MEVDEPEAVAVPQVTADSDPTETVETEADDNVSFDSMSEEELLAGIEGLVAPEKSDDY